MKEMMYNNRIGVTSGCTLRMMEDTVGDDTPFNGIIGDAWFGSTRTFSEVAWNHQFQQERLREDDDNYKVCQCS
jgi:hypothetical protein